MIKKGSYLLLGIYALLFGAVIISSIIFEKKISSSRVMGTLIYDQVYKCLREEEGWCEIELAAGKSGWVQRQFLDEGV